MMKDYNDNNDPLLDNNIEKNLTNYFLQNS